MGQQEGPHEKLVVITNTSTKGSLMVTAKGDFRMHVRAAYTYDCRHKHRHTLAITGSLGRGSRKGVNSAGTTHGGHYPPDTPRRGTASGSSEGGTQLLEPLC